MDSFIKISIIVPAYNAEKVIKKCVQSICGQTIREIEILAVDDGSTDNTRQVLEELAHHDSRIRLIKKDQNEGLSAARNTALSFALGEYVGFVDADDWVEADYFRIMYEQGRSADLIVAGYSHDSMAENLSETYVARTVRMKPRFITEKKKIVSAAAYVDAGKMFAYTWNKLYKKTVMDRSHRLFSRQVLIEDFLYNTLYWDDIESLSIIENSGYHYVKASKEALTQRFLPDFAEIMDIRYEAIRDLLKKNDLFNGIRREYLANVYIKHAVAGIARNCSREGKYTFGTRLSRASAQIKGINALEARKYSKGVSWQEKGCNMVFKSGNPLLLLLLGRIIYWMQTKSHTAFDKMK